ncbi:MAG: purine-binding chemotaxis protein CheW [Phycisphaerales bacterium]|nr:purine-binding chemotaxis protein CheW [Phycisphaerales bacterium]
MNPAPTASLHESDQLTSASSRTAGNQLQLVTFGIGDEEFGVDILAVQEINRMMQLTRVPQSPFGVEGVINLRGKIIPVLDLHERFGLAATEHDEHSRIIVVAVHGHVIGFIVDRVHEVLRIDSGIIEPAPHIETLRGLRAEPRFEQLAIPQGFCYFKSGQHNGAKP